MAVKKKEEPEVEEAVVEPEAPVASVESLIVAAGDASAVLTIDGAAYVLTPVQVAGARRAFERVAYELS